MADVPPAPPPPDNPLQGLVPYAAPIPGRFPHSLEFDYLPLSAMMRGPRTFDWSPLDRLLDAVKGRGNQTVFRVFVEYPGKKEGIPEFLLRDGLKVHRYVNTNTAPFPPTEVVTPDYADPRLRRALRDFVLALGARVDGDPRVAYVTAGLLGTWGEWHDYPRDDLFAGKAVQTEVMDAYQAAFRKTPVLLRYPAGPGDPVYAPNHDRPFGYHDDSFAWATLDTGKPQDDWFFVPRLRAAGAAGKWRRHPIGGEIRPEAWGKVFDPEPGLPEIQDFARCVDATHATFLMDTGMFREAASPERRARAIAQVRRMGFAPRVLSVAPAVTAGAVGVRLVWTNVGVAPHHHGWGAQIGLADSRGAIVRHAPCRGRLAGLLPGQRRTWDERIDTRGLAPGRHTLLLRVPNPMPQGRPLRFANAGQDADVPGWLTLATVEPKPAAR